MSDKILTIVVVSFNTLFHFFILVIPSLTKSYHINNFTHININIIPSSYQIYYFVYVSLYSKIHLVIFKVNNL